MSGDELGELHPGSDTKKPIRCNSHSRTYFEKRSGRISSCAKGNRKLETVDKTTALMCRMRNVRLRSDQNGAEIGSGKTHDIYF